MLIEGREAPDFTLPDQGRERRLAPRPARQVVVVYFYPRADALG